MNRTAFLLGSGLLLLGAFASGQEAADPATYSNVTLVSADPARRIVVVRDSKGRRQTLQMDDLLAGIGSVKPGDHVIVTVRGGPGQRRISAISRTSDPAAPVLVTSPPRRSAGRPPTIASNRASVKDAFAQQVATLSGEARSVDSMWASFVTACNARPTSAGAGRDWFGLWDGRVQADYSGSQCRDQFNQIIAAGEPIVRGMVAAEAVADKTLTAGEIRDIRKLNLMDWDGWTLPAPQKREP